MKTPITSVLIPTDFSDSSESALKMGIAIAKRQHAAITILHVADRFSYLQPAEVFLPDFRPIPDILTMMEERIRELADRIQHDTGLKTTGTLMHGLPSDQICQCAFDQKADLIIMGTHGASGLREFFIGSVAFSVVKHASCPVLTIPGNWNKTDFERVLIPVRLLPGATEKYQFARPIIEKNNSELFVLGLSEKNRPEELEDLSHIINSLKMQLQHDNVAFQSAFCPSDDFSATVFSVTKKYGADLIILTANLDFSVKAFFIGPFSQQVVNHAKVPVLSIKPSPVQTNPSDVFGLSENWGRSIDFSQLGMQT